jgi:membrane protein
MVVTLGQCLERIVRRPSRFFLRVVIGFRRNQGLLLSGAVAYYALLSIVPLLGLLLIGLSHVMEQDALLDTVRVNLRLLLPSQADALTKEFDVFLAHRQVVGGVGIFVLLFFSSMAFTVLENAMCVIFFHRVTLHRRHFLVSALIPYAFIFFLAVGLLLVTLISGWLQALEREQVELLGRTWSLVGFAGGVLYGLGVVGLMMMLTALYLVMPLGRIALRHALAGGVTAALLWEMARHLLVWYFSTLSFVSVIYGSLATAVVALLSFEVAAIILLFGAQVIAEFERCNLAQDTGSDTGFET